MNFCPRLFHRARPKRPVNSAPDQEFKRLVRNRKIETALPEPGELIGYRKPRDFALSVRAKRSENDLLVEAPDELQRSRMRAVRK